MTDDSKTLWGDGPTVILYHGTSSEFAAEILQNGLQFPKETLEEFAMEVLRDYVGEESMTEYLIKKIVPYASRTALGRHGERGKSIFCKNSAEGVAGYAESYATHGGEIAYDVWNLLCIEMVDPETTVREMKTNPPILPRFANGKPIIVKIEVPREWCSFDLDTTRMVAHVQEKNEDPEKVQQILKKITANTEVRVTKPIPTSMIISLDQSGITA
jgi:hypothetical protein